MFGTYPNHNILSNWRLSKNKYELVPFHPATTRELIKPKTLTYVAREHMFYLLGSEGL